MKYLFIYFFRDRGEGKEKDMERNINVREKHRSVASCTCPTRDQTCNPGTCPDWESNLQPFTLQDNVQPPEPHWSGAITSQCFLDRFLKHL